MYGHRRAQPDVTVVRLEAIDTDGDDEIFNGTNQEITHYRRSNWRCPMASIPTPSKSMGEALLVRDHIH